MAVVKRVRRLVNPRRTKRAKGKRRNPRHRRRLTPAQIKAGFGGKRARSAMRAARRRKAKGGHKSHRRRTNPKPRTRTRVVTKIKTRWRTRKSSSKAKAHRKRSRRRQNPAGLLVTYGPALNPHKRRKSVAKRRRKNPRRATGHRRRTRVVTKYRYRTRARRRNPGRRRRHRNPGALAGMGGVRGMGTAIAGGLVGVTINKTVTAMLPATLITSPLIRVVASAAIAWGSGALAGKFIGAEFGKYVMFGGLMQAGSLALNTFIPSIGSMIGLQGLVPSNDILLPYNAFAGRGAMVGPGGGGRMSSAFPQPFA